MSSEYDRAILQTEISEVRQLAELFRRIDDNLQHSMAGLELLSEVMERSSSLLNTWIAVFQGSA